MIRMPRHPPFMSAMFKPVFDALKPGGVFLLMSSDTEVVCLKSYPNCVLSHGREIDGVTSRYTAEMIKRTGSTMKISLSDIRSPRNTARSVWPVNVELGPNPTACPIGHPFL